jgi:DNA polymerase III alpha subunit
MSADPPPFAELHCRSNFTFLVGASQPEEFVERAAAKLYSALAGYGTDEEWISEACLLEKGIDPADPRVIHWLTIADTIRGFPRHLSQHPGGFVIGRDKLSRLVPVENAAMENRSVIQWDKDDLDATGLIKVDILALGMLSAIHRALFGPRRSPARLSLGDRGQAAHRLSLCGETATGIRP